MRLLLSLCFCRSTAVSTFVTGSSPLTGLPEPTQQQRDGVCRMMTPQNNAVRDSLLQGVDVTKDKYFSSDIGSGLLNLMWLDTPGLAWKAAEKDAQALHMTTEDYLMTVKNRMKKFKRSRIVFDRDDIYRVITSFLEEEGFYLVLGGKSVGKSLVLRDIQKLVNKSELRSPASGQEMLFLLVDGRDTAYQSILASLRKGWENLVVECPSLFPWKNVQQAINFFAPILDPTSISNLTVPYGTGHPWWKFWKRRSKQAGPGAFLSSSMIEGVLKMMQADLPDTKLLDLFMAKCMAMNRVPVLIIDEANLVLGQGEDRAAFLKYLTKLTKQENRLVVILASSKHGYPYLLSESNMNLNDIASSLVVSEIPPKAMWQLLTSATYQEDYSAFNITKGEQTIGMGEHLAHLLMTSYGGHYLKTISAVLMLDTIKEMFELSMKLPNGQNVTRCLNEGEQAGDELAMANLLNQMSRHGFAPIPSPDIKNAKLLSLYNIGGVVSLTDSFAPGIDSKLWRDTDSRFALVPTSESMRITIAFELKRYNKK